MALRSETTDGALQARRLHPALGAEVSGIDMRRPLDVATREALHAAWMEHIVLVFPGQHISDEDHVGFSRNFGAVEVFHQNIIKSKRVPEIFRVANTDEDGKLLPPSDHVVRQLSSAQLWHTDSSYRPIPSMGSLLRGLEVVREGGVTCFTNMYLVWERLPEALKARVRGRKARHNFGYIRVLRGLPPVSEEDARKMPPVWQPMLRQHPVTGRTSLFISTIYNDEVEGMGPDEAKRFIAELAEFCGRDEFVYRHKWRTDDVVMWDNRCTMHYVTPFDPGQRRVMHRTTIVGDGPVIAAA
ncbi:MAG: TauD/TfdA family dioxygenase [Alphaproteobacteria bacterium]|nr:TauD/TfdA family dioxygenase [Alphaproteobacteria bacterium]